MKNSKRMDDIKAVYKQCGLLTESGEFKRKDDVPEIPKTNYGNVSLKFNTNKSILK